MLRSLGEQQSVYVNGRPVARDVSRSREGVEVGLPEDCFRAGTNVVVVVATPTPGMGSGNGPERGNPGLIRFTTPPGNWGRSLFNGLAQLIVQSTGTPGEIIVTARSPGLSSARLTLQAQPAPMRPRVASR